MIPMAQGCSMCNLGQIGGNVSKLSIKASMKKMKWESVAMEQLSMQSFMSKWIKQSQVMLELGSTQIMQGKAFQKKRISSWGKGLLAWLAWGVNESME